MILDGGLATTLEARGWDLNDPLWSARVLLDYPQAIGDVHRAFLDAGADCIVTATYQASVPGFRRRGLDERQAADCLRLAVQLALDARKAFREEHVDRADRVKPLVAAGIGPYGAYLADGSEYTGAYDVGDEALRAFHVERWHLLAGTGADLLAVETVPSGREVDVLLRLLEETPERWAWISVSCRDEGHLWDGTPVAEVARACEDVANVAAVGINCTAPALAGSLIAEVQRETTRPILVYPNRGERYDPGTGTWGPGDLAVDLAVAADEWRRLGAVGIGGCCRVGPDVIAAMRERLVGKEGA